MAKRTMTEPKEKSTKETEGESTLLSFTLTDGQVAEIKKAFDFLEPDDKFVPENNLLTLNQWKEFREKFEKRHHDPRRARPI